MRNLLGRIWRMLTAPFRFVGHLLRRLFAAPMRFFADEPEDTPLGETVQKAISHPGEVLQHLAALRGHLLRATLALILVAVITFQYSGVLLAVLAAAITPTVDPLNMLLVWVPLTFLYFLSVGTASLGQRQHTRRISA